MSIKQPSKSKFFLDLHMKYSIFSESTPAYLNDMAEFSIFNKHMKHFQRQIISLESQLITISFHIKSLIWDSSYGQLLHRKENSMDS